MTLSYIPLYPYWWCLGLLVILLSSLKFAGRLLRGYMVRRYTTIDDLPILGVKRAVKIDGTAVVCGGSISGLLTARVCSDHFNHVLIIDPELTEVERTKASTRIAQYDSLHGYLTFVLDGLRRLWPTFDSELKNVGGCIAPGDVKPYFGGTLLPAPYDEYAVEGKKLPETMFVRRPHLENLLRRLLLGSSSNIRTLPGTVRGLHVTHDSDARISSVIIRGQKNEEMSISDPTLVVDCSGNSQSGYKWLRKCGYEELSNARLEYDQRLYYVTITFTVSAEMKIELPIPGGYDAAGWVYTFVPDYNFGNAGFVLGKMDNDTMQLCCGGWGDVTLPTQAEDIEAYLRSCKGREPVPEWLIDIIHILTDRGSAQFKPLRIRPCAYIRYQDIPNLPRNFVAVGDSVLQLNPIYAQGCSKAMMGAVALNSQLASIDLSSNKLPSDFSRAYFHAVGNHCDALWESTKIFDYGFSSTRPAKGETLRAGAFARWYLDHFIETALKDKELASAMWHIRMLLAPPTDMFTPSILLKVISHALSSRIHHYLR